MNKKSNSESKIFRKKQYSENYSCNFPAVAESFSKPNFTNFVDLTIPLPTAMLQTASAVFPFGHTNQAFLHHLPTAAIELTFTEVAPTSSC